MTVAEILEQIKALTVLPRKELVKQVIDLIDAPQPAKDDERGEHWGQNLLRILDELGPIELAHPEIEDPVEWVKAQRHKREEQLKLYWDTDER